MAVFDAYEKAHRLAEACYEKDISLQRNPYLPVLDNILNGVTIKKESRPVIREIPLKQVVGTRTEGRTQAFASNFMPLLKANTEFADKWSVLYKAQMEEGIREPVKVYELFGRYYVQEGNKRVSVLKFCKSPTILADVRTITIDPEDLDEIHSKLYSAYMEFQKAVNFPEIVMSRPSNYKKLMNILDASPEEPLDPAQVKDLRSLYATFSTAMEKSGLFDQLERGVLKGNPFDNDTKLHPDQKGQPRPYLNLPKESLTMGDAFMQYLKTYGFAPEKAVPQKAMIKELEKLFHINPQKNGTYVMTDTEASDRSKSRISSLLSGPLKAAFICSKDGISSSWTADHLRAIRQAEQELGSDVQISVYENANTPKEVTQAIDAAIAKGNEVIFTTNPLMLQQANHVAANYPKLKVLNNSLNLDTGLLRTYYAREYEVMFLLGLLAGVLTQTHRIGYLASYPINGEVADINAFAIGVSMTSPTAKVYLDWTTTTESTLENNPLNTDIVYIEGNKFDPHLVSDRLYGLFDVGRGKFFNIATIKTNWAVFYIKILKSILNGTWASDQNKAGQESINYWWGLSNGLLELEFSEKLPLQVRRLAVQLRDDMANGTFMPFEGEIEDQEGNVHNWSTGAFLPDLVTMDWLVGNVVGSIPKASQLVEDAQEVVEQHGLPRTTEGE